MHTDTTKAMNNEIYITVLSRYGAHAITLSTEEIQGSPIPIPFRLLLIVPSF